MFALLCTLSSAFAQEVPNYDFNVVDRERFGQLLAGVPDPNRIRHQYGGAGWHGLPKRFVPDDHPSPELLASGR